MSNVTQLRVSIHASECHTYTARDVVARMYICVNLVGKSVAVPFCKDCCRSSHSIYIHTHVGHISHVCSMTRAYCAMTHAYMCHASYMYAPWPVHMCAMTHAYETHISHDSFKCTMTHVHVCKTSGRSNISLNRVGVHDLCIYVPWLIVPWLMHICAMTHAYQIPHD